MITAYNTVYCVCDEEFDSFVADSPRCLEWSSMLAAVSRALRELSELAGDG